MIKKPQSPLPDIIKGADDSMDRVVTILEHFSKEVKASRLNENVIYAVLAKHLEMKITDLKFIVSHAASGKLRRELFKPAKL